MNTAKYAKKPNLSKFTLTPPPPTNFLVLALIAIFALFLAGCPSPDNSKPETDTRPTYTVTVVQPQGGTINVSHTKAKKGTTITLSNIPTPATSFTIAHYTVNGVPQTHSKFTLTKNVTVSGVFTRDGSETFTVTFNSNDGTAVSSQTVVAGGLVIPRVTTRDGYTIDGWYRESTFINKWNFATDTVTANRTLYAKWNQNAPGTVTVTFDTDGGSWVNPQNTGSHAYQPETPIRTGYTFDDWYVDADYSARFTFNVPVADNRIVYAKWIPLIYSIKYDKNAAGAIGSTANSDHTYDVAQLLSANGFSRDRWTFAGWNTMDDGSGTSYTDGESVKNLSAAQDEVVTLYAQWLFFSSGTSNDFRYTGMGLEITITGYTGSNKAITIPAKIEGLPVTAIGEQAFYYKSLTSVTIPSSVTSIGNLAFADNQFTKITIPSSVTFIGDRAFQKNQLTSITIPNNVTTIGDYAFYFNKLESLTIGNSVTTIGSSAFARNQLTSITIPNSVTYLSGFDNNQLTNVTIPNSVTTIGDYAFYNNKLTGNLIIPNSVTSIRSNAFAGNYNNSDSAAWLIYPTYPTNDGNQLTSIIIGNSVTDIGSYAFYNNKLTSVIIPNSVTTIGDYAFYNNKLTGNLIIPNSVTSIKSNAFAGNYNIYDSYNPTNDGNQLTSVTLGNSVTNIGYNAFSYNQLTNITIPNSVTEIDRGAFANNQLTSITIGANVSLESSSFDYSFYDTYNNGGKLAGTYTRVWEWTRYDSTAPSYFTFNSATGTITGYSESGPKNVMIPSAINGVPVTAIRESTFADKDLTSVIIPDSVTEIGERAFTSNQLTSVVIPNSVTSIGIYAFALNQLTSVTIPNGITTIGELTFSFNRLTSVVIPNSVTSIGTSAFVSNRLTSVTIGANVEFGTNAFSDSSNGNYVPSGFETAYNNGGKLAGTYTRASTSSTVWVKQP